MNRKTKTFFGAFAITGILIGALCGFVAVDLSTDRYMPDTFGPFLEITSIDSGGVNFNFMAGDYRFENKTVILALKELSKFRGLLPAVPRAAGYLAGRGAVYAAEQADSQNLYP